MPVSKDNRMSSMKNTSTAVSKPDMKADPSVMSKHSRYGTTTVCHTISKNIKVSQNVLKRESGDITPYEGMIALLLYWN